MVNMETNCRKLRRIKGSSKKKKRISCHDLSDLTRVKPDDSGTSTPPRSPTSHVIVESTQEKDRGVEWQYHKKFVETDIPVVWGSPNGSPVVKPGQTVDESPRHRPKRRTMCRVPTKIRSEESNPPQFLNEILALSEKIKANEKDSDLMQNNPCTEVESVISENVQEESFSNFFDEDMNECMIQCSQQLEEISKGNFQSSESREIVDNGTNDQKNKKTVASSNFSHSTPRRKTANEISLLNTSSGVFHTRDHVKEVETKASRVGNKNYVHSIRKTNTYVFQGRVLGAQVNTGALNPKACGSAQIKASSSLQSKTCSLDSKLQTDRQKFQRAPKSKKSYTSLDQSFETVKNSFLDDGMELLCTLPDDLEIISLSKGGQFSDKNTLNPKESNLDNNRKASNSTFEDSAYFEEGVLRFLDEVESNVSSSPVLICTPEEIEKKRQEAKRKLEKNFQKSSD